MRYLFTERAFYKAGPQPFPVYEKDTVYELTEDFGERWVRRQVAARDPDGKAEAHPDPRLAQAEAGAAVVTLTRTEQVNYERMGKPSLLELAAKRPDLAFTDKNTRAEIIAGLQSPVRTAEQIAADDAAAKTAADAEAQLRALLETAEPVKGASRGTGRAQKLFVMAPWPKVTAVAAAALAAKAPGVDVAEDRSVTFTFENGKAVYAFKGSLPEAEIYELTDGASYEAAPAE